jgi:hypothetical protein
MIVSVPSLSLYFIFATRRSPLPCVRACVCVRVRVCPPGRAA